MQTQENILATYPKDIQAGYTWMVKHYGNDWYQSIDTSTLDVNDPVLCPVGQVDPTHNFYSVFLDSEGDIDWTLIHSLGFAEDLSHPPGYITIQWVHLIKDLRHFEEKV